MKKISIVTISYNSEKTIERTIKSVIAQNYPDLEYIIIDGASTDGTLDIIKKYDSFITKWVSEKDAGISDAFNKGIKMAAGDFIILLNSDDELLPGILEFVDQNVSDDIDVAHFNLIYHKQNGERFENKPDLDYNRLLKVGMTLNHVGMFINRKAYEKYGLYNTDYKCVMDRELLARMYSQGAVFKYFDRTSAVFYMGGESTVNVLKHAVPETSKISLLYGASKKSIISYKIKKYTIVYLSRFKHFVLGDYKNDR